VFAPHTALHGSKIGYFCGRYKSLRLFLHFFDFIDFDLPPPSVPEIIDPIFAKSSQNARFLLSENERFGLVFVKTGSINSGTGIDSTVLIPCKYQFRRGMIIGKGGGRARDQSRFCHGAMAEGIFEPRRPVISDLDEKGVLLYQQGTPIRFQLGRHFMMDPKQHQL
jgi:hypothetical protein